MENTVFRCGYCECEYDTSEDFVTVEGIEVCEQCYQKNVVVCQICGEMKLIDNATTIENADGYETLDICMECMENDDRVQYCDYHERYEFFENNDDMYSIVNYGMICQDAYSCGNFGYCEDCDRFFALDDMQWIEDECDERLYCYECAEEILANRMIKPYHSHSYYTVDLLNDENENTTLTFGIELEVEKAEDSYTDREEMATKIYNCDRFGMFGYENDGSLYDGFEIISRPMSLGFIEENEREFLQEMFELLEDNRYQSFCRSSCGHHIHVGKKPFSATSLNLLNAIMEYFKEELTILSRRDEEQLNRWAKFDTMIYNKEQLDLTPSLINRSMSRNRYRFLNMTNRNTIEIRIFRGTISYKEYLTRLYIVNNMCRYAIDNEELYEEIFDKETKMLSSLNLKDIMLYSATSEQEQFIMNYLESRNMIEKLFPQALAY